MEVFNKLYSQVSSSVSSTVSQLSGVLPGNPVTREFDATTHIASAGPGLLWKIYKGSKRSTKQEASIFVFEKRQLDKFSKTDRETIIETLRRGIIHLTKIRHPQILTVQHPLEESRESLAFATEPVFASLSNVLGKTTNMPQPANISDYKLYDIEIKYGILQITEGLAFLHNDMKLVHKNICPESIVLNSQGVWKIFGFDMCVLNVNPANLPPNYPYDGYLPTLPEICQSNLDYLAPECVLNQTHSTASDMFSLGMLCYTLYSVQNQAITPVKNIQQFRSRVQQLKTLNSSYMLCLPDSLRDYVKMLLNVNPESRPDAHQFSKISYFDDFGVKTLNYLDSLLQWDNLQKSQFYKGLPEALAALPQRVKVQRVLSCLARDLTQPIMIPFILPSIFDIAQECTKEEFCAYILPLLKPIMKIMEPIQILLIMLQRMELLLKLTPAVDIQQHVLPMLYRGLDSDSTQIHELCLSILPTFAGLLDHSNVKNSLLPRIKKLCLSTSTLSVRVNCLLCVGKLLEHLDKWLVLDEVLPFLPQIPSREPAVLMGILGIYKLTLNHKKLGMSKEIIATRILPFLIPLCIENGLTLTQFNALIALTKEMFQIVENEHRIKLQQLNSVKDEQKALTSSISSLNVNAKPTDLGSTFEGLGLNSFAAKNENQNKSLSSPRELTPIPAPTWPATTNNLTTPGKDLTSVLMTEWSNSSSQFQTSPAFSSNDSRSQNQFQASLAFSPAVTPKPTFPMQKTSFPQSNYGNNGNWNNLSWTNSTPSNMQQNWNALDNLLTMNNNSKSKTPINQPLLAPSTNATVETKRNSNNALSNEEIMDLLK